MLQDDLGGFGDARLRRVGARLLDAMCQKPTTCIHALAVDRNQELAFGRFLDPSSVSYSEMLTTSGRFTGQRAVGRHVLAIQDTTEFNFPRHADSKHGFGRSGNDCDLGLFLHPAIAVDAVHGGIIGLVGAQVLNRTRTKVDASKPRAIEDKESYRWLLATEEAADVLAGAACITVVADRESDIDEPFARRPAGVHLLTRAAQDRLLVDGARLFATMDAWPERHRETIVLPAHPHSRLSLACSVARSPGRRERHACLGLRFGRVSLRRPAAADSKRDGKTEQVLADALDPAHEPALMALNEKLEGRTEKLKNPHPQGRLAWLSWIVVRLSGWSGYTSHGYKPAGPKTIARGLARLDGIIEGWAFYSADVRLP